MTDDLLRQIRREESSIQFFAEKIARYDTRMLQAQHRLRDLQEQASQRLADEVLKMIQPT
jgi:hypothetical protein